MILPGPYECRAPDIMYACTCTCTCTSIVLHKEKLYCDIHIHVCTVHVGKKSVADTCSCCPGLSLQLYVEYKENFKQSTTNHHNFVSPDSHGSPTDT